MDDTSFLSSQKHEDCFGCFACKDVCPKSCIHISEDECGFLYPSVNIDQCVNCKLCERTCPRVCHSFITKRNVKAYAGTHKSITVVKESSSGGLFSAIATVAIDEGYVVYGAKFSEELKVIHDKATTISECERFRKSKYIQSNTANIFKYIRKDLIAGGKVLFTGTPCQIAAVKAYLNCFSLDVDHNLITVSLLCHGVPNQKIFDSYVNWVEKTERKKVVNYSFRCKELVNGSFNSRSAKITFADGTEKIVDLHNDPFLKGYYKKLFIRPSCGKCIFAQQDRIADVTLSDAWKIEQLFPEYDTLKGVSLILTATNKGESIIEKIKELVNIQPIDPEWALNSQAIFKRPVEFHENYKKFLSMYKKGVPISSAVNHCVVWLPFGRIKRIIKARTKKLLNRFKLQANSHK